MFLTPEQLHRKKQIKKFIITLVLSIMGISVAVALSVLLGNL
ncbi:hypothetical protein [Halalkalibacter alkalisediminis]|uniref:DUF4044 domain-containing protein n=1 Tax=Halalkalibacter alkalisediminis TaxID=935616 RepID=A0ABV6NCP0_9BACI|nr:hypothetical protein [Halalkalibacter alkalisediminis]